MGSERSSWPVDPRMVIYCGDAGAQASALTAQVDGLLHPSSDGNLARDRQPPLQA